MTTAKYLAHRAIMLLGTLAAFAFVIDGAQSAGNQPNLLTRSGPSRRTPIRRLLDSPGQTRLRSRQRFRSRNDTFAGRSASRRMKYGYHSEPYGT